MLSIFVCEDNRQQLDRITKAINNTVLIENYDMEIKVSTKNPFDVLEYIKNNKGAGIYFLDVDLKSSINGIELGEKIRKYDPRGFIIFITTHGEMSPLTFEYKVEALDYIIKNDFKNIENRIYECLINANEKYSMTGYELQKVYHITNGDRIIHVEFDKIIFFETSSTAHKIILHAIDRQIEFYGHLRDIINQLDERFYKCHKSFIINKDKIKEFDKKKRIVSLINEQQCLVAFRCVKGLYS